MMPETPGDHQKSGKIQILGHPEIQHFLPGNDDFDINFCHPYYLSTPILASLQVGMGAKHFPSTGMRHVESGSGKQRPIVCDGDAVAP